MILFQQQPRVTFVFRQNGNMSPALEGVGMELRPEQQKALQYLRRKGTEETSNGVKRRVAQAFQAMEEAVCPLGEEVARRSPGEKRWSIQEVVDHLIASHRPAVRQLAALMDGHSPGGPIPAGLLSKDSFAQPWAAAVAELCQVHRDFLAVLARGTDSTSLDAKAPVAMVIKARDENGDLHTLEWIEEFDWKAYGVAVGAHSREHQAQVMRLLGG